MDNPKGNRHALWLFAGPAIIHIWWGWCVLLSPKELKTTGLFDIYRLCGHNHELTAFVLFMIGLTSLESILIYDSHPRASLLLLCPQQTAMLISALTAYRCIDESRFADGLPYDSFFIAADQCYIFIIGLCHTALIVHVYMWEGLKSWISRSTQ